MPVGAMVAGSVITGMMAKRAADKQADAARGSIGEQRRQFDLVREDTKPYRQVGQNALYEMSGMLGLGGRDEGRLNELRGQLGDTDKFLTTGGRLEERERKIHRGPGRGTTETYQVFVPEETSINPEFERLESEIADLEAQISEDGGGDGFDITETPGYQFRFDEGVNALNRSLAATGGRFSGRAGKEAMRFGQGLASQEFGNRFNRLSGLAGTGQAAVGTSGQAGMQTARGVGNALMRGGQAQAQGLANMNRSIQGGIGNVLAYRQNQQLLDRLGRGGVEAGTGRRAY